MGVVSCWMVVGHILYPGSWILYPIYSQLNPAVGILVSAINRDTRYYFLLFNRAHAPCHHEAVRNEGPRSQVARQQCVVV